MKVMVIVKATPDSEAGNLPSQELLAEMGQYNQELVQAGIMLAGEGLHPTSRGYRVRFSGKNRTVTQGPFTETNELIAGYWLWQVKSMEDAIEWVKRCPNPMLVDSDIEIRQVFAMEDFAEMDPSGEIRAAEQEMLDEVARYQLEPPRFENGRELLIAGEQNSYTQDTRSQIPAQWERFTPLLPGRQGTEAYGVCWSDDPTCGFEYLSGVEVSNADSLPEGTSHVRLPAQRYAVFTHPGHVSGLAQTLDAIWKKWLPNSSHQAAKAPFFERYTDDFVPETGEGGVEIWIPLQA
ncbi:GyrI-like domain-containing protein [Lignipirellula cremea]|uniref:Bacterial transcription activator, effector binding domain n=1 Tax=Lignipirellula cremea TaxID=2528010 RepID=A0A518DST5_9BACT|nr:GyrI-like domain-containing protein [Lignipirellula cremea]QDU94902.1 Bacterial transcription activator, effector binding domain [Lignipirellula cremea]